MNEADFLSLFKISDGKYIIGIFQDTITVYKQQMRALNIFHALVHQKIIPLGEYFSIAIIGGGIAGVTFAAAALKSNISVTLFEKEAEYLHMQQGCDTRKIHPNIYDWPDLGSTFPNARLPVLSWTYDTASNVAKQIVNGLAEISREIENSDHFQAPALFNPYPSCKIEEVIEPNENTHNQFTIIHGNPKIKSYANLIVYAVGFGVERELDESNAPSYWRNDALSQSILSNKRSFLVSGVGDGALIDLCRIKIRNYSYDRVLELLKANPQKYAQLIHRLRDLKVRGLAQNPLNKDFYEKEFDQIEENYYKYFYESLKKDIVLENTIYFNSRRPEDQTLDFSKVSMMNAFIIYLLKRNGHLILKQGELTFSNDKYYINNDEVTGVDQFVIRHGTDTSEMIENMYLSEREKVNLRNLQQLQKYDRTNENCWTFGSISTCFIRGSQNPDLTVIPYLKRSEYVTPDTKALCMPFVMMLAKMISRIPNGPRNFRLALHRVTKFDNDGYFQQITPYHGSQLAIDNGSYGNVHNINYGIVGQAISSGKAVLTIQGNAEDNKLLSEKLNLKTKSEDSVPAAFNLAIPIVAPTKSGKLATNLVFYLNGDNVEFVTRKESLELIVSCIQGLIDYIETMLSKGMITMCELEFEPYLITGFKPEDIVEVSCFMDIEKEKEYPSKANLKLKEFYSFDIIYNK